MIEFFIHRSFLVNLLSIIIVIVGVLSVITLQKDTFPTVSFGMIIINTSYPGTTPEDVEKRITIELEKKIKDIDGIKELNAMSFEGRSILYLKIDPDYDDKKVLADVKDGIDSINDFPKEVKGPFVKMAKNTHRSILKIALTGKDEMLVRRIAKDLRDKIELVRGIAKAELRGYRNEEVLVEVSPKKLNRYQVTVDEVAEAIKGRNMNLSAGKLETPTAELLIRTRGEFESTKDIENIIVHSNNTGANVRISQIGKVRRVLSRSSIFNRAQRSNAIYLNVKKKLTADVLTTTNKTKEVLKDFFTQRKDNGVNYLIVDELAFFVKRRLGVLTSSALLGFLLVIGGLFLFLNFRISIVTSLGAPIAFLSAFALMDVMGISINLISMFGLILVLGMLVDDAIIVSEHFYQHIEKGIAPKEAAILAAHETVGPVTATILTTMLAFGSLFFMGGIMGKFLWQVPAVVIICLAASWIECFFIMPSHLANFVRPKDILAKKRRWYDSFRDAYVKVLGVCLRHYFLTVITFFALLVMSCILAKSMRFELFPGDDVREVFINIKGQVGDPLEKTEKAVIKIENILYEIIQEDELRAIRGMVGTQVKQRSAGRGTHYGGFIIYLTDPSQRKRSTDQILKEINQRVKPAIPGYEILTKKRVGGPPRGGLAEVQLKSNSLDDLKQASLEVISLFKKIEGVISVESDFEEGKIQLIVDVNEMEVKRLGLSTVKVAQGVRRAYGGDSVTTIRESDEDVEVILKLDEKSRSQVNVLKDLYLLNNRGQRIQLSRIAKIKKEVGVFIIRRLDRKRIISVNGDLDKKKITPVEFASQLRPEVEEVVKKYPSMSFIMGGENKDTKESMVRLSKATVIALGAIFLVLVTMFGGLGQPLIILLAIPLGLIGVILTFKILGLSLGFMAMMGMIGLVGVVVNDSIVLVNFINKKRRLEKAIVDVILEAAHSRFRPIILTSCTTVASLLPIAHGKGGDPFLRPMAISFAWGLTFSTAVTLLFIPCAYLIYHKLFHFFSRLFSKDGPR